MAAETMRVQSIASMSVSLDTIPPEFIRSEDEQPGKTTFKGASPEIPVVDLSKPNSSKAVFEAASKWGIFQVVNHGIPNEVINELQRVGKEFFELTQEVKEVYAAVPGSLEGYGTSLQKEVEGKKAWTDYLFHNIWPPSAINYKFWPKNPPAYRKANEEYAKHLRRVVDDLLWNLSTGLNLEKHAFKDALGGEDLEMLLKISYYPPCPRPDLALGVVAHTDLSAVTVLVPNDVPGLQFFKDDHWVCVKYVPGALIIHIGDQIEILSNGKYKSVLHRAIVNKDKTRISWPVFCSPPMEKAIGPLPQLITEYNPPKYKAKKYKDYQYCKINKLTQ